MKPTERELPTGLPPLPPGTRYAGRLKDYEDRVNGWVLDELEGGWVKGDGWCCGVNFTTSREWHLAVPIEDEAEPEVVKDGWLPIETAPKDDSCIDLWCVDPDGEFIPKHGGIRLVDCYWHEADEVLNATGWIRVLGDGNWDLIEGPPASICGLPPWKPTHWRREPNPPTP